MSSDEDELPPTRSGSEADEDELPETDPEDANDSFDDDVVVVNPKKPIVAAEEELPETDPEDSLDSGKEEVSKPKPVPDEDYDSFDEFVPTQPSPSPTKQPHLETKKPVKTFASFSSSSSEDSDVANDSEFVPNTDNDESQRPRTYKLRTRKAIPVRPKVSDNDDGDDIDDSLDDTEFVEASLKERETIQIKGKTCFLDGGEFLTDTTAPQIDKETQRKWANMTSPPPEALKTLDEFYGHKAFRPKQWDVVRNTLAGKDQFVLMSTGYGKSVCYQMPSLLLNTMTVVVSPLISLMNDQVNTLVAKGISAIKLDGDSNQKTWDSVQNNVHRIRFIYMSPEMITSNRGLELLSKCKDHLSLLAIDEAHCVSQWGHDFRNSYRHLASIRNRSDLCNIPMIALTATATVRVRDDVIQNLHLRNPPITTTSFDRKNLYISVHSSKNVVSDLDEFLIKDPVKGPHFGGPTIVYCQTKQMVDDVNSALRQMGVCSAHYHAGLTKNQREKAHTDFMRDKITTIVATVAFGMGIDKPDVRNVIHYGCPKDIESYYQEMGRAGRDGAPSVCRMFWGPKDMVTNKFKLRNSNLKEEVLENLTLMLRQLELVLSTMGCRRYQLLKHFDPTYAKPALPQANCCDRCTAMLDGNLDTSSSIVDVTKEAKWMFQVIREMYDGKTGIGKPIEFLRGSSKEEWRMKTLQQKALFGVGKELSLKWWTELGKALRLAGFLGEVKPIQMKFGSCVTLNDTAEQWLLNGKELKIEATPTLLQGKAPRPPPGAPKTPGAARSQSYATDEKIILGSVKKRDYKSASENEHLKNMKQQHDESLPEKVRLLRIRLDDLRVEMSTMYEVAPFQIVSNTVLDSFANIRPDSVLKLDVIEGMSAAQKARYGKRFVDCVVQFAAETKIGLNVSANDTIPESISAVMERELTEAVRRTYRHHILTKCDAKDISSVRGIAESTVYSYLTTAVEKGLPVYLEKLKVGRKIINIALKAVREKLGSNVIRLAPWKDAIGDVIDYNQLKLAKGILIYEYGIENSKDDDFVESPGTSSAAPPPQKSAYRPTASGYKPPAAKKFKL